MKWGMQIVSLQMITILTPQKGWEFHGEVWGVDQNIYHKEMYQMRISCREKLLFSPQFSVFTSAML